MTIVALRLLPIALHTTRWEIRDALGQVSAIHDQGFIRPGLEGLKRFCDYTQEGQLTNGQRRYLQLQVHSR